MSRDDERWPVTSRPSRISYHGLTMLDLASRVRHAEPRTNGSRESSVAKTGHALGRVACYPEKESMGNWGSLALLRRGQLQQIHEATIEVLAKTGVRFANPYVRRVCTEAGFTFRGEGVVVFTRRHQGQYGALLQAG